MSTPEAPAQDNPSKLEAEIVATASGLSALLDWSEAHPEIPLQQCGLTWVVADYEAPHLTHDEIVRAIADGSRIGDIAKSTHSLTDDRDIFTVTRKFGGAVELQHHANRDDVCERVVTGTRTVTKPDPAAPLVEVEEEVVEWRCSPLLAGSGDSKTGSNQ